MATYNKFNSWVEFMQEGANVGSDQFVIALTNSAPSAANTVLGDLTQIAYTNLSSRNLTTATEAQTGGTYTLDFNDITLTSTGGTTGPFRYVVVYDDTVAGDPLVCWFDYGSSITLDAGESLELTFNASGLYTVT
jgi:hypothetical protein